MPSIVSERFKIHNAKQFVESFSEAAKDNYYLFIGRSMPWATGDTASDVPTPTDSTGCAAFRYWRDMIAMVKIQPTDLCHAIYNHEWTSGAKYRMYDCSISINSLFDPEEMPFYVVTSENQVFKCIYNGVTDNSGTTISNSTVEPSITGQADVTALTIADGNPNNYIWKYMYTIPASDLLKFRVKNYVPVRSMDDTRDSLTGDVLDDASSNYLVFNNARLVNNGAIYQVIIDTPGAGYSNIPPQVIIEGDGTGATAVASVSSGNVVSITMTSYGQNYSYATVALNSLDKQPTIPAVARAIISPRNEFTNTAGNYYRTNHGLDIEHELGGKYVILSARLFNTGGVGEEAVLPISSEYRRVGIVKNPVLYGTNQIANGNAYSMTTDVVIGSATGSFVPNELIYQASTNAYGVLLEQKDNILRLTNVRGEFSIEGNTVVMGIGNGNTTVSLPEAFISPIQPSGTQARVSEVLPPDITPFSGDVLYINHGTPIIREQNYSEIVKIVLTF